MGTHAAPRSLRLREGVPLASTGGAPGKRGPTAVPSPPSAEASPAAASSLAARAGAAVASPGPGVGREVRGQGTEAQPNAGGRPVQARPSPGAEAPRSITRSLADLDRRLGQMGGGGMAGVAGVQMGSVFFDPEGADFTAWVNHLTTEVYRNWIVPPSALFGFGGGHVDIEFWVERDGTLTDLRILKSSGTPALDRAARNALTGSRLLPLPADYAPPRIRFQVTFTYGPERG
jgi:TonB family protein